MHILVCSPSWPTEKTIDFVFVEQLCRAFANQGHKITVIAPQSLTKCLVRHVPLAKRHYKFQTAKGNIIEVYRPYTLSFGNTGVKLRFGTFNQAVKRAFKRIKDKPDICYGHFWNSLFSLYPLAKNKDLPLFGASGEENVSLYVHLPNDKIKEIKTYICGLVSVSTKNQGECLELNLIDKDKCIVIPNAIDRSLFCKLDKEDCRTKFGIIRSDFVVAFVGQFVSRKGTLRLNEALKRIGDNHIKAVFIGTGIEEPDYEGIIQKGRVSHEDVPRWLNAADVFVLPTENEGCSNAIIEAMACGLPIISTDAPFNYDILNESNSILIDCHDIDAIASAIRRLKDNKELRQQLSNGAFSTAENLSIDRRAERIIEFMQNKLKNDNR